MSQERVSRIIYQKKKEKKKRKRKERVSRFVI